MQNAWKSRRADERIRTAALLITSDHSGVAEACTGLQMLRIWAVFSALPCSGLHGIAYPVVSERYQEAVV